MAFEGFLSLGGTEIANAARTKVYADELVPLLGLSDCWGCGDLAEALGHETYTTPMIDQPDWFSHHDRDSWDFCGFYPLEIEGLDDGVREATVTELSLDGAAVGAPRYRARDIRVTGLLIGATDAAVTYGLTWLAKALEGTPCRDDANGCTGDHLCYYAACPPMCTDSPALDEWGDPAEGGTPFYLCDGGMIETAERACSVEYERTLYRVTTTGGPTVVERYNSKCGSMVRVEFTMVAGVPFAFSTAISAVPGVVPIPDPQISDEITCDPGTDIVVRTNLATNPIPVGNAAVAGGGWQADGDGFTVSPDEDVFRLEDGASVRVWRDEVTDSPNLAPNPDPADTLDGWGYRLGQSVPAQVRTNLVENPFPASTGSDDGEATADGWVYTDPTDTVALDVGPMIRQNLATNPNMERGVQGWIKFFGPIVTQDTTQFHSGTASLRVEKTSENDDTIRAYNGVSSANVSGPVAAGTQVHASVWVLADIGVRYLVALKRDAGRGGDGEVEYVGTGQWQQHTIDLVAPDDREFYVLLVNIVGDQDPGTVVWIDEALLEIGTAGPYFDGDTLDTPTAHYQWLGTAGNAVSQVATALDLGPDLRPGYGHTAIGAEDWQVTYTGTQVLDAGVEYRASVYVWVTTTQDLQFAGQAHTAVAYDWTRLSGIVTGTGGPLTLVVAGTGQDEHGQLRVARALVEEGTALGVYFDGDTPDGGGWDYEWTGEVAASTSTASPVTVAATTELVADGDGPGGQDSYQRTTIVVPKYGAESGAVYTMDLGPGEYTTDMWVRTSIAIDVALRVSAIDVNGTVLRSSHGTLLSVRADEWTRLGPVHILAPEGTQRLQVAALMPGDQVLPEDATFDAAAVQVVDGLYLTDPVLGRVTFMGQHDDDVATIDVVPGGVYTASVYAGANVGAIAWMTIRFYTASGGPAGLARGLDMELEASLTPLGVTEWQRPWVTAKAPENAASAVVSIVVRKVASGAMVGDGAWVTSLLMEQSPDLLSYFDGTMDDSGDVSYEWTGTAHASTSQALLSLPAEPKPIKDPDCPVVPDPPRPPLIDISCVGQPTQWRRYVVGVGDDLVPEWRDAVPVIRLQTGGTAVRQVRIRFYPNPLEAPLAALNPCDFCGEFVVTYIPANSLMTIDGIREWATITTRNGDVVTANHLLASSDGGPVEWPSLGCGVGYTLVVDVSPTSVADLAPQICLAARS